MTRKIYRELNLQNYSIMELYYLAKNIYPRLDLNFNKNNKTVVYNNNYRYNNLNNKNSQNKIYNQPFNNNQIHNN